MKTRLTDSELFEELKLRLESNNRMIIEQKFLMQQLQDVNNKLVKSEQLKTNFLSNIRNEINNPLASILELAKNISGTEMDKSTVSKLATYLYNEAFILDFQLRNIFVSAELEAGDSVLSVCAINIKAFTENFIGHFNNLLVKKSLTLRANIQIKPDQVFYSDPEKLHIILSNILFNAIQFSPEGEIIELECEVSNDTLIISIKDNGIGIDPINHNKIFDRFYQIDSGSSKLFSGHGLGLSLCASLMELIHGELFLDSRLNNGSKFTVKVNQAETTDFTNDVFSTDGNEFLFNNKDGNFQL